MALLLSLTTRAIRYLCSLQFIVPNGDSGNPFVELHEQDVLVLRLLVTFVEHGHHAVNKRYPEVLRSQRVPIVTILRTCCQTHVVHFKNFESGALEPKGASNGKVIKDLLELLQPERQNVDNHRIVLNLSPESHDGSCLAKGRKTLVNEFFKLFVDTALMILHDCI